MQRWTAIAAGGFLLVMIGALVLKGGHRGILNDIAKGDAGRENTVDAKHIPEAGIDDPLWAELESDAGTTLAATLTASDAEAAAPLPTGSPKMVRFGVILVQYRGAQLAPASARPKDEALSLARSIAEAARTDFKSQVSKGDPGSMEDAGRIPRGVLEPAAEYALFTMAPGGVSDPVETPRGFWIVKRIE